MHVRANSPLFLLSEAMGRQSRRADCGAHGTAHGRVAGWVGGEFGGEWLHVSVWLSLFAVHLELSQRCLLISYIPIQNKKLKKSSENLVKGKI